MLQKISPYFNPYLEEGICIAFSGGADSSLLLKAACLAREAYLSGTQREPSADSPGGSSITEAARSGSAEADCRGNSKSCPPPILAVIAQTKLHPHEDTVLAQALAQSMGAECLVLKIDEFDDPRIMDNPPNRCFLCKRLLFSSIKKSAADLGRLHVFDGSNESDTREYRPGLAALAELQIKSPLMELGISKLQVRELSRQLGLKTSDKPATPCMATRLPYGARLNYDLLDRIHQGETALRQMGFYNVRLRFHDPLVRIEVDHRDLERVVGQRETVISLIKNLGFSYVTLDLEGFRSGSMDLGLTAADPG